MTTQLQLKRLVLEIQKLQRGPASLKEIAEYLEADAEILHHDLSISERTFARDRLAIYDIFEIDIKYNKEIRKYEIEYENLSDISVRLFEAITIFDALNFTERLDKCLHLETRRPTGIEHLAKLIRAVKLQNEVEIIHHKHSEPNIGKKRILLPYGIKEHKNWWFLLAKEKGNEMLKSFAFDRISEVKVSRQVFEKDPNFDINEYYKYSYGATVYAHKEPEEIIISVTGAAIPYFKTSLFHSSQEILLDTPEELRLKFKLYITWELVAELRGEGSYVQVLAPESLRDNLLTYRYEELF